MQRQVWRSGWRSRSCGLVLVGLPFWSACAFEDYQEQPLQSGALVADLVVERGDLAAAASGPMTLARAVELLRVRGPEVHVAIAEFRSAWSSAGVETPWPNPTVEVGPQFGFGSSVTSRRVVPVVGLGLTIPLSDRLEREDEVRRARAEAARTSALARFRELHVELRQRYVEAWVGRARFALAERRVEAAEQAQALASRLVRAGEFGASDVSRLRLDLERARTDVLTAEQQALHAEGELARMLAVDHVDLGVRGDWWSGLPESGVASVGTEVDALRNQMIEVHPELQRIRAEYLVAESQLRREIAEQYPDLAIGSVFSGDPGDPKTMLGLSLGIELPLFDRNQQGIADARARREQVRERYRARVQHALSELAAAVRERELAERRAASASGRALARALEHQRETRRAATAGLLGASAVLAADRTALEVEGDALDAYAAHQDACFRLERVVGCPLFELGLGAEMSAAPPAQLTTVEEQS